MQAFQSYIHSYQDSFILENINTTIEKLQTLFTPYIGSSFLCYLHSKSRKWLQLKSKQQLLFTNSYLLIILVTLLLGIQNLSLYKIKTTNCYLIAVTSRLGLSSQVTHARFVYAHDLSFYCFVLDSKDLQC
jgi:uncharacterized Tic20 family protein